MPRASDRRLLYASAFIRALATGMIGVLVGIYLAKLGFDTAAIGGLVALGLVGCAVAALAATIAGDRFGRRRFLLVLGLLGTAGGAALAVSSSGVVIAAAVFLGMVNGMGRDRGAALVLEQAILPSTAGEAERTRILAWYNVLQDAGHAFGSLLAGLPVLIRAGFGSFGAAPAGAVTGEIGSLRIAVGVYAVLVLATTVAYWKLSPAVEAPPQQRATFVSNRLSPDSRRILVRISALFSLDSLGGGFLTTALLSFFFYERFGVGEGTISVLFFAARILNAFSHLGAAWLAGRIGLVNTMVFTHIPSSLLLLTVPFAPNFAVAAILFLIREGLVEMDVPTRQSYVLAVVLPEERTIASGVTNLVRMAGWAIAPSFAGLFMGGIWIAAPLYAGAGMKILYDILLYSAFRRIRPPEEGSASSRPSAEGRLAPEWPSPPTG